MIKRIDHVAIAVADLDESIELFEKVLGLRMARREKVAGHDVETATFDLGETAIELVEGKGEGSAIRKFVERRGPGIHHIAVAVDDIERTLAELRAKGVRLIDESPRPGRAHSRVAFIHPDSTQKVLLELVQTEQEE